jgi:hypothetical protein
MKRSYVSRPICMMFFALLLTFAQPQAFSQSRSATNELAKSERERVTSRLKRKDST